MAMASVYSFSGIQRAGFNCSVDLRRHSKGCWSLTWRSILEFGGANSCFIDQILEEVAPARYDVIDSNQLGLDLLHSRYASDDRVSVSLGDVLAPSAPKRLYDIVFSVGLIEHFDPAGTAKAVAAHFSAEPAAIAASTSSAIGRVTSRILGASSVVHLVNRT